ncbi:hypothetical protein JDV02_009885 [Purpureocillium takamizusanense]|uniref:Uncharacterized protein n=1 Tax=Purpureocillium takamizusanense TaxID=2060973 RepID=A0A9Q8VEN9_9HYPO|nr:uncharacterized protein JDV02_009885 [Purpureocillium takamizusanense]UNI24110.1 hypothetical protein JDV02_009885 [Purpureocillium takamizusanense]
MKAAVMDGGDGDADADVDEEGVPPQASQASSHFALDPVPATVLAAREAARRNAARALGPCGVGCAEVDDEALLGAGGLERGTVVGVSCEDEDGFGLTLCLQVVARALLAHEHDKVLVVTPRPAGVLLRALRDGIAAELRARREAASAEEAAVARGVSGAEDEEGGAADKGGAGRGEEDAAAAAEVRACLDRVMLSCVFDVDGLWEVLAELDRPAEGEMTTTTTPPPPPESLVHGRADEVEGKRQQQVVDTAAAAPLLEIQDSEDEGLTPSPRSTPGAPQPHATAEPDGEATTATETALGEHRGAGDGRENEGPSIVLVTHFSALLTSLFAHREKSAAHSSLQLLASQARYLSRSLPSQPLFMLLNSTSSSSSAHDGSREPGATGSGPAAAPGPGPAPVSAPAGGGSAITTNKPLDPTLRSVFNPLALPLPAYRAPRAATRRNKPSFGLIFSQILDTHLLCTRMPRTRADADALYGGSSSNSTGDGNAEDNGCRPLPPQRQHQHQQPGAIKYVTVVEVLLDEMGLWQGRAGPRPNREQRWGVVDVVGGRVVDAFARTQRVYGEIRTSGGFGGRRP